jgi:hypothetical protein
MTSLVDEILFAFANERDTNGNEYKLRLSALAAWQSALCRAGDVDVSDAAPSD